MTVILAAIATSFIITFLVIPVIIKYSQRKGKLMDTPGRRKIHKRLTPSLGGIGIFVGFFIASLIWMPLEAFSQYKFIMAALSIIFLVGARDDILPLKPLYKLIGQVVAAGMITMLSGIQLESFYGIFGIYELHEPLSYLLTVFTIIVITNSFNLIDGLDGLAGTIASICLIFYGSWFFLVGETFMAIMIFSMLGAVFAFLNFNWEPSKIFMGDTGALVLGFLFALLTVKFIDFNYHLARPNSFHFEATVTTGICVMIIPLFDTLRIFILRLTKKQSPFTPDKNHMHHALMRLGLRHSQTAITLGIINLIYIGIAILGKGTSDFILLPVILVVSVLFSLALDYMIIRKLTKGASQYSKSKAKKTTV